MDARARRSNTRLRRCPTSMFLERRCPTSRHPQHGRPTAMFLELPHALADGTRNTGPRVAIGADQARVEVARSDRDARSRLQRAATGWAAPPSATAIPSALRRRCGGFAYRWMTCKHCPWAPQAAVGAHAVRALNRTRTRSELTKSMGLRRVAAPASATASEPLRGGLDSGDRRSIAPRLAAAWLQRLGIDIHLLGQARVCVSGVPIRFANRGITLAMFAYLILHRDRAVPRETLAFTLFPDLPESDAYKQLRRYLYLAQKALPDMPVARGSKPMPNRSAGTRPPPRRSTSLSSSGWPRRRQR